MHLILAGALAGMLATPHCAGMCGGFATACARPRGGLAAWHAGRVATYAVLGVIAGTAGRTLPGPAWLPAALAMMLLVWFAAGMAGLAPQPTLRLPGLSRAAQRVAGRTRAAPRFLFGALTGLLPCGMVYAGLGMAVAAGGPVMGGVVMAAFGAATVPGLTALSLGLQRIAVRSLWTRRAVALLILMFGLWSVGLRGFSAARAAGGGHAEAHAPHVAEP